MVQPGRTGADDWRRLSLWLAHPALDLTPRPPLPESLDVDVAIVGAGLTGLWTAVHLAEADPGLRIVVLDARTAGYGASGRNGGWCSALFPASLDSLAALPGSSWQRARAQQAAMEQSVRLVGSDAARLGIDCHYAAGGTLVLARNRAQWTRARQEVEHARRWGSGEDDLRLLDAAQARQVLSASRVRGATYTPHCAALHPALLVRGLASAAERLGVRIFEQTPVRAIRPGSAGGRPQAQTDHGRVRADVVVRATEGYTPRLSGLERAVVPVSSLIVATEPLPPGTWDQIGLRRRETFADHRHLIVYGQRTADDRLVFGGRGAPYAFGSWISDAQDRHARVFTRLRAEVTDLFPVLRGVRFTHAWGGVLAVPRDWCAGVGLDRATGLAWAGGYVGDGVSTTHLAGRTLRDLVLGHETDLTRLPWVGHRSPAWEPEPLRWLGINTGLRAMTAADVEERITGRPSLIARAVAPLIG